MATQGVTYPTTGPQVFGSSEDELKAKAEMQARTVQALNLCRALPEKVVWSNCLLLQNKLLPLDPTRIELGPMTRNQQGGSDAEMLYRVEDPANPGHFELKPVNIQTPEWMNTRFGAKFWPRTPKTNFESYSFDSDFFGIDKSLGLQAFLWTLMAAEHRLRNLAWDNRDKWFRRGAIKTPEFLDSMITRRLSAITESEKDGKVIEHLPRIDYQIRKSKNGPDVGVYEEGAAPNAAPKGFDTLIAKSIAKERIRHKTISSWQKLSVVKNTIRWPLVLQSVQLPRPPRGVKGNAFVDVLRNPNAATPSGGATSAMDIQGGDDDTAGSQSPMLD